MTVPLEEFSGVRLDLPLKGEREYLHGTDIFQEMVAISNQVTLHDEPKDLGISFHALAVTGLTIFPKPPESGTYAAFFSFFGNNERHKLYLVEDGRPITSRRPFSESDIVAGTVFSKLEPDFCATAELDVMQGFTPIESWIAMVKALHLKEFPIEAGKWLFTRGQFSQYSEFKGASKYRVTLENAVGGTFTRCAIHVDGERIGDVFFSLMSGG